MKITSSTIPPVPVPVNYRLELELSAAELFALLSIVERVGGRSDGPRGVADALVVAIQNVGPHDMCEQDLFETSDEHGRDAIEFADCATARFKNFKF